jgi:hypothetical protein
MNYKLALIATSIILAGCSGAPTKPEGLDSGPITAINAQKLSSSFKRQGIKLEWDCKWGSGVFEATCIKGEATAIEVTGYAPSFGNSEVMRETAFIVAQTSALDKLARFIKQDINSSRVITTLTKNIEKAQDRTKSKINNNDTVEMADDDKSKDTNNAVRENTNETVRTVTDNIRTSAQAILRGVKTVDEAIVDRQTVSVTIRWDKNSAAMAEYLGKRISR